MFGRVHPVLSMRCITLLISLLSLSFGIAGESVAPVDAISQDAVQSAFQILSRDYIRKEDLTYEHLNRVALEGLLKRLEFGAELVQKKTLPESQRRPLVAELPATGIAYLRPQQLSEEELLEIESKLKLWAKDAAVQHLLLDLRQPLPAGEFEPTARLLECFLPEGRVLYKLKQLVKAGNALGEAELKIASRAPLWGKHLLVLVDGDTNNQGEAVAAVLQQQRRALLLGAGTRGATVVYEKAALDEHWELRFACAELLLADDSSLFRKGVQPDMVVVLDHKTKLDLFQKQGVKESMRETPRPRFNETALVHGQNPELTDFIRRSRGQELPTDATRPRDVVLQRAVDLCQSADHLAGQRLEWKSATSTKKSEAKRAEVVK